MSTLDSLSKTLSDLAASAEPNLVLEATMQLVGWLNANPSDVDKFDIRYLDCLRSNLHFEALKLLTETLSRLGRSEPRIRQYLAQALINTGTPSVAVDVLKPMANKKSVNANDRAETLGLLARAYKDIYVASGSKAHSSSKKALRAAIRNYGAVYKESGETNFWSGENLVALLQKADRDGLSMEGTADSEVIAEKIAGFITRTPADRRTYWQWASLAAAHVARGDWNSASTAIAAALETDDIDAFKLEGTIRQLKEVCGLQDINADGAGLVVSLQSRLLRLTGGRVEMSAKDVQTARSLDDTQYEKIFGAEGPRTRAWMLKFLAAGEAVGLISKSLGTGIGTCFIVDGKDFHSSLAGERLVLTNDHVVSPEPEAYKSNPPLRPEKTSVSFEVFAQNGGMPRTIDIKEIVWSSLGTAHDACLLRLKEPLPDALSSLPLTDLVPLADEEDPEGVYVIGHPGGRGLSYSMQNNELLDHDCKSAVQDDVEPRHIHYFTPTEPGSSGSPAMNADLDVIGLHHAGGTYMSKLNGKHGTYKANEAVWIKSIRCAAKADIIGNRVRWGG